MHPAVQIRVEGPRGCGYRKPGGTYLVSDGIGVPCGKLPIPMHVCPTCKHGIKPTRGWTWINGTKFARKKVCESSPCEATCPLRQDPGMVGLLWIGGCYYPTPKDWAREAVRMGVSRRIAKVPRGFEVGRTWVWVGHAKAMQVPCPAKCPPAAVGQPVCKKCKGAGTVGRPAVFHAFRPQRIEYVVREDDPDEKIEGLIARGFTCVKVVRDIDSNLLFNEG
jgi:hypothetical protein